MSFVELGWITAAFCIAVCVVAMCPLLAIVRRSTVLRKHLARIQDNSVFIQLPMLKVELDRVNAALPRIQLQTARTKAAMSQIGSDINSLRIPQAFAAARLAASSVKLLLAALH
ncbi:MAG: hypothetical protein M3Y21_04545 [Candidatus Eremiobacteraeota bacterium]|nr:hypothetical protein [Candidatus Eremiobacteraeota bacterium]